MPIVKRDKPALAEWIIDQRKAMNLKPDSLARELTRLGYEVKEATVRGWEAGARPGEAGIRTLERLFASKAPSEDEQPTADLAALVASNARLAAAIERQNEIREAELAIQRDQTMALLLLAQEMQTVHLGQLAMAEAMAADDVARGRLRREPRRADTPATTPSDRLPGPARRSSETGAT